MRIYYAADIDRIYVEGTANTWAARSLVAQVMPDGIYVCVALALSCILGPLAPGMVQRVDGSVFGDQVSAVAYLESEFARFDADQDGAPIVAAVAMPAGTAVAISRTNGQLVPALASGSKALAFVAGVLREPVQAGFAVIPSQGAVALANWTSIIGQTALATGQPYFLASGGGLVTAPVDPAAIFITRVGLAISATTLVVRPFDPLQL